jgi:hypothetical protein
MTILLSEHSLRSCQTLDLVEDHSIKLKLIGRGFSEIIALLVRAVGLATPVRGGVNNTHSGGDDFPPENLIGSH